MILYFIKLSFALALMYLFYQAILKRTTFYQCNRWYLLVYSVFCCWLASFDVPVSFSSGPFTNGYLPNPFYTLQNIAFIPARSFSERAEANIVLSQWLTIVYCTGTSIMFLRIIWQWISFVRLRSKARLFTVKQGIAVYQVDKNIVPFSFGRSIYIKTGLTEENGYTAIFLHEEVHAKQLHTIDVIWTELLVTCNWFNPFAWLIRGAVRQNLEYIADAQVLGKGVEKKRYQYLLLKMMDEQHINITNAFNFTSLKQRIIMMNRMHTRRMHLTRFLLLLPLTAICLFSFRGFNSGTSSDPDITSTPFTVSCVLHRDDGMNDRNKQFFTRNPDILLLRWRKGTTQLDIYLKEEKIEPYDLSDRAQVKKAETLYGKLPQPAPGSVSIEK